ncbi:internalin, partial [Methanosarcina sp. DH2]|nr:internalin [Methanosarcina sp. DH2]
VTDPLIGNLIGPAESLNNDNILEVGETWTYTGTYTVTQQDINSNGGGDGDIDNTATVDSEELPPQEDSEEVPIQQNASYTIDKIVTDVAGNGPTGNVTKAGDVISYQINVTNTGNVDLTNLSVTDTLIGNLTGPVESINSNEILEVGETWTYTGTYTATLIDVITNGGGDGFIENIATVDSDQLGPESDSAAVPIKIIPVYEPNPAYEIEKSIMDVDSRGPAASVKEAGDVITYSIVVTNTGDADLTNVAVTDSLINLAGPVESKNKDNVLEVGETWTYTGMYTVTQQDIDTEGGFDGYIDNVATVDCDQLDSKSDSARAPIEASPVFEPCPAYKIEKCVTDVDCRGPTASVTEAGDVITYRITVVNTGNIDLTNVAVTDPLIKTLNGPVESKNVNGILDVGEIWTYTGSYKVTQGDIEINGECDRNINNVALVGCDSDTISKCYGYIDNVATVDCNQLDPKSDSVRVIIKKASTEEDSAEEYPIEKKQDYCIYKSIIGVDQAGDYIINKPGDIIEYQILVKNEGNTDLTGVSVSDPMITLIGPTGDEIGPGVLNPGETWKFVGNYTVTQTDINSNGGGDGFIDNTATVSCNELPDESSSVKQPIVLTSTDDVNSSDDANSNDGANSNGGNGGNGNAHVFSKPAKDVEMNENNAGETGTEILLEPEIKSFEQNIGNAEANVEKVPEQEESKGIPGLVIYGIIGLLAILLFIFLHKRK